VLQSLHRKVSLEQLKTAFTTSQELILEGIEETVADNQELVGKIASFMLHEMYHIGQTGIIRRLIGKEGAIT